MAKTETTWHPVDTEALPKDAAKRWEAVQQARAKVREAEAAFEKAMLPHVKKAKLPDGSPLIPGDCEPAFGYRFGRLAIAAVKRAAKREGSKSTALRLG